MSDFYYSDDNKRYHTLSYYNKHKYGYKVFKASVDAGLTCPNIDGSKGFEGCIYCDGGSAYFTDGAKPIKKQIENEIERIRLINHVHKFIVYYQSNSNTYTSAENLRSMIETAINFKDVIGVTLSSRADCITNETINILNDYKKDTNICVELGLQSIHNETLKTINRCQTFEEFLEGYEMLKNNSIRTCIHLINGLPYETEDMMIETASQVGKLKPDALKIHMLHIIKGTRIEDFFKERLFDLLTKEQYIDIVTKQLKYIPAQTVIERLTGDGDKHKLVAPMWTKDKISVLGGIDKALAEKNTFQGAKFIDM